MKRESILAVASWFAVIVLMAFICFKLVDQFAPAYPEEPMRYTTQSYKSLEYENAQNRAARIQAERFIREMAEGNLR